MIRDANFQTVEKIGNSSENIQGPKFRISCGKSVMLLYPGKGQCLDFLSC